MPALTLGEDGIPGLLLEEGAVATLCRGSKSWGSFHEQAAKSLRHKTAQRNVTQTRVPWEDSDK